MMADLVRASRLAVLFAALGLILGAGTLGLGLQEGAVAGWGFGTTCLLQAALSLNVWQRLREGLGNRGLERERITLWIVSHLLRLLALGMTLASIAAFMGERGPLASPAFLGLATLAVTCLVPLWHAKRGQAEIHPTLGLDMARSRTLLELAVLLLAGVALGRWFLWADAAAGLAMALRLFLEGRALGKVSTLAAAGCGSCGSCGCG